MKKLFDWISELFHPKRKPVYRIYGNKWKVISLSDGTWDYDTESFPTLFVSDRTDSLLWLSIDLHTYWNGQGDGYRYNFRADKNRDLMMDWVWV